MRFARRINYIGLFIILAVLNDSFEWKNLTWCDGMYENLTDLGEAMVSCKNSSDCFGVYDIHCDHENFRLCQSQVFHTSKTSSCVYKKKHDRIEVTGMLYNHNIRIK